MTTNTTDVTAYVLRHADDCLVLAQRLGEWSSRAHELEEDIALTNIALDLLGQARHLYSLAGVREGMGRVEDDFAFFRSEREFSNVLLVEQPNGDFAFTMARQLFFDAYQLPFWQDLASSSDPDLAGIAAKAAKENRYHLRHAAEWVVRMGDGTEESHSRAQAALDEAWRWTGTLFMPGPGEDLLTAEGIAPSLPALEPAWRAMVAEVTERATLALPEEPAPTGAGYRRADQTEHLGLLLAEMQIVARSHPGAEW